VAVGSISTAIGEAAEQGTLAGFVQRIAEAFSLDPATQHLSIALLITPLAMVLSGLFFLLGIRTVK
jgi:hypothetical protein